MTQAQTTVAKPAAKPAKSAAAKPANKPAKSAQKPAAKPAAAGAQFYVKDSFRPAAGRMLFAYTMAWLQESGLIDGGSIPRADAIKLAGGTAIAYHTGKTNRMIDTKGTLTLAPGGANFFCDRPGIDAKDVEAYREMLRTGQPDGQRIKAAAAFAPIKPAASPAK